MTDSWEKGACCLGHAGHVSRRRFLKRALVGAGLAAYGGPQALLAATHGGIEALLLSCIDYRLIDDMVRYMDGRKLTHKYDQFILAGASLGVVTDKYPAWGRTFWDHLGLAIDLHKIRTVIALDHRDCGAYKLLVGPSYGKDRATDTTIHAEHLRKLRAAIRVNQPRLGVELLLMDVNGTLETIA